MTIEDIDEIEKIVMERATGKAQRLISDHLPWDVDESRHLELLQTKVYRCLDAIESGELYQRAPMTDGRDCTLAEADAALVRNR